MGTLRFRELVKVAGKPEIKSLWTDPKRDRDFLRAAKQHRVLTVIQEPHKRDFGEVGFHQQPHASYFLFPKPLKAAEGTRVVGIKYDLVEESEVKNPVSLREARIPKKRKHRVLPELKPVEKHFKVRVRRTAVSEDVVGVSALTKADAREKAVEEVKKREFYLGGAEVEVKVLGIE